MELYEIIPLIKNIHLKTKESWEQSRLIAYTNISPHAKNMKPINEFIQFSWDKEETENISDDAEMDLDKMKQELLNMEDILNGKK